MQNPEALSRKVWTEKCDGPTSGYQAVILGGIRIHLDGEAITFT